MKDLILLPLSQLVEDPENARVHGDRNLSVIAESLKTNDQYAPLVIQKSTMRIVVGNGRYRAMRMMGWTEAWCVVKELNNEQARRLSLIDNRSAELASWDDRALATALKQLDSNISLNELGWSDSELSMLFDKAFPPAAKPGKDKPKEGGGKSGTAPPAGDPSQKGGRFILVYADDEQKEFWMTLVGLDGNRVVYTTEDVKSEEGEGAAADGQVKA